ncbi:MAG TPA: NUDIX domain-containing protein [Beijerinckiaceae bacterium]|nr:NUDIX domain-containing protein [Beijerinckiaceae bacterium]
MIAARLIKHLNSRAVMRLVRWRGLLVAPMTLGVRGIVLNAERRVFLVRHSYVGGWHFPGGGVEPGETVREALTRELGEEGNIVVEGELRLHGFYFNDRYSRRDHIAVFVIRDFRQTAPRAPDWEIIGAEFFPLESLPVDTTTAVRQTLAELIDGTPIRENW